MSLYSFSDRHIGPGKQETAEMLKSIGVNSIDELINQTIPSDIRLPEALSIGEAVDETTYINNLRKLAAKNKMFRTYIGLGYYGTVTPPVILRNVLENPGWYTAYTPYQAEIAQGRLEALLNFQTIISDLTGLPMANASLLDESTAAAEGMTMLFHTRSKEQVKNNAVKFFVSDEIFPQTLDVLKTRAEPLGIELEIGDYSTFNFDDNFYGVILQYPGKNGAIYDYSGFAAKCKTKEIRIVVAADILSLVM